jgi:hypothetical protein
MKDLVLGCIPSTMDGSEKIFGVSEEVTIPESYSYRDVLPDVLNQGSLSICVPCTVSSYLNWKENLKDGSNKDNKIVLNDIYKSRTNHGEGMTYKDALSFLRKKGVKSNSGTLTIDSYGLVNSPLLLKYALIMNGPCFGALPVYSNYCEFWLKRFNEPLQGYHAIAIVGYNEKGFIIRNSWGRSFCDKGYTILPYEDFNKLIEIWTVIK